MEELGSRSMVLDAFLRTGGGGQASNRTQAESRLIALAASNAISGDAFAWAAAYVGPSEAILRMIKEKVLKLLHRARSC